MRDVVIHPDHLDEVFPGTGTVKPAAALRNLQEVGYHSAIAPEHVPKLPGEKRNEISKAWAAGYGRAVLNQIENLE